MMDPNALSNILGGVLEGSIGLVGGIVVTVFAFKVRGGKNGSAEACSGVNGHCNDHKELARDVRKTKEVSIAVQTDVKWLVAAARNGNGRSHKK